MTTPTCFSLSWTEPDVAHLALNRPESLNTMGPTFWRELDGLLREIHDEGRARALVISSTGKHFSAGMALETFGGAITLDDRSPEGRAAVFDLLAQMQATFTRLETLRAPVIFAIQGGCVGGAVDMVTAGCIRYASADAFFCIQEINIGMVADVGTLQRLPKLGLVNEVFDSHAATVEAALQCAREIASKPPVAIWGTKQAVNYARDHSVDDSLRQMGWLQGAIWSNAQVGEAIVAAKERRAGRFAPLAPLKSFLDAE